MNIDITDLKNGTIKEILVDKKIEIPKIMYEKTEIISLEDISVSGYIINNNMNYDIDLNLKGTMILPCSVTLKPVAYKFSTKIDGNIDKLLEEIGETSKKTQNTIDILPIIWENILMEIPIKVISDEAKDIKLKGNGWQLVTEKKEELNPELQKLKDLFK